MSSLKKEIASLHLTNAELNEAVQSVMSESGISTFEDGKYTDDVRACVYELLSLNVGVRNVAPIIRCVLKNVAHMSVLWINLPDDVRIISCSSSSAW